MKSVAYNMDCLEAMRQMPDKVFDLAIVDPPYGGGQHFNFRYGVGDAVYRSDKPHRDYFTELRRVSEDQIVWGGNYFSHELCSSRAWICWDKLNACDGFSDFELAWTSFDQVSRTFRHCNNGGFIISKGVDKKIHPTQKPVALYKWLLTNYAKQGDSILDTHLGSGSSRIAAYDLGFDFAGYELDKDYFDAQEERFKNHIAQAKLFEPQPVETQEALF